MYTDYDHTRVETTTRAAARAYAEAGIENPREATSMAEVHGSFSVTEAVIMEDLQFSPQGKVINDVMSGRLNLDGPQPVQPDGGLECSNHPIGASGIRMIYEMYKELQGKADKRQLKNPKHGPTHNLGGISYRSIASISSWGYK
jgi:acetyl-CoA C-acetyltransferase